MSKKPLLYYRTLDQISAHKKLPAIQKLKWLEMQMEFYHTAMPKKSKPDSGTTQKRNIVKLPGAWYCELFNP